MKNTMQRTLSLILTLALALTLAVPALGAKIPVTGVRLDQTSLTLTPGQTAQLTATVLPEDATNQGVTWSSNQPSVVKVSSSGKVTALAEGSAAITVTTRDGSWPAICAVTVAPRAVTAVTITPAGPESLPVGATRQLTAAVEYNAGDPGTEVTWSSSDPKTAKVDASGKVTALQEGAVVITAQSKEMDKDGKPCSGSYALTVTLPDPTIAQDSLTASPTRQELQAGLLQSRTLKAPAVSLMNGDIGVAENYDVTYTWYDAANQPIEGTETCIILPTTQQDLRYTCEVTATHKRDSSHVLTRTCAYLVKVLPSTSVGAQVTLQGGPVTLDKLTSVTGITVLDQLVKGVADDPLTPALTGLTRVSFDLDSVTGGDAGTLNAKAGVSYQLIGTADLLTSLTFTPAAAGTYTIGFTAYGKDTWYGQLEIVVTDGQQTPVTPPSDPSGGKLTCDSTGFTFSGSDFYHSDSDSPILSLRFGAPSAGKLLRNFFKGSGVADTGQTYYTNSAKDGDHHISTLSYLPPVGYSGQVTIPVTMTAQNGHVHQETITATVTSTDTSRYFLDVVPATVGTWAANSVDFAYGCELMNGMGNDFFEPYVPMTRGMLVTVLYRAAGSPNAAVTTNFTDLDPSAYYYAPVLWATVNGIVTGIDDTTFAPNNSLTREQLATILYRYANVMGVSTEITGTMGAYTDQDQISPYARQPMLWAVTRGIISGLTTDLLDPQGSATRAQVAVILHRYMIGQ